MKLNFSKQLLVSNAYANSRLLNFSKSLSTKQEEQSKPKENEEKLDDLFKNVVIEVRSHEKAVLGSYTKFIKLATQGLDLSENLVNIETPTRFIERWTILKSKFVKKKHFRQYEMRTHFKVYRFENLTGSTCSTLLEYFQRNLPEGVSMYVYKTKLEWLPENLAREQTSTQQ